MIGQAGRRFAPLVMVLTLSVALLVTVSACASPLSGASGAAPTVPAATTTASGIFPAFATPTTATAISHPVPSTIYAVGDNGNLDALNSVSGAVQWGVHVGGQASGGLPGDYLDAYTQGIIFVTAAQADPSFPRMPGVGHLNAVDPQTHAILWTTHLRVIYLAAQAGVVYVSDATGIAALNARTDQRFWHYDEPQAYPLGFALGNGVAYLSYAANAQTAYVDAIRLSDGARLWQSVLQGLALDSVVYGGGIVYTTARGANFTQTIEAFSAASGQHLWSVRAGGAGLAIVAVADGRVFIHTQGSDASGSLLVLDARTGQQSPGFSNHSQPAACVLNAPVLAANVLYVPCSTPGKSIYAYDASSGTLAWQGQVAGDYISVGGAQGGIVYSVGHFTGGETTMTAAVQTSNGGLLWQRAGSYVGAKSGVAFVSANATLYALDAATGHLLWQNARLGADIGVLA